MNKAKSYLIKTAFLTFLGLFVGTAAIAEGPDVDQARADLYEGKKARIIIPIFKDKTSSSGEYREAFGRGMSDMLVTALFDTDRFSVLDREYAEVTKREGGKLVKPDLFIVGAITGFDPNAKGGKVNLDNIPYGKTFGGLFGKKSTAYIAMNVRIVDVETGLVVASTNIEGKASKYGGSAAIGGAMPASMSTYGGTPMEPAIRAMIEKAVKYVVKKTPKRYYRYEF